MIGYWNIAWGKSSIGSKSRATAKERSNSSSLALPRWPTKCVSIGSGRLASSSQWMLLSCFSPSSTPTVTWVRKPSYREYTGAQTTEENFASVNTWRLTTTKTRSLRGSAGPERVTRDRSPQCTYCVIPWNSNTSDCSLSSSATRSRMTASLASRSVFARRARYDSAARSRKADRLSSIRSISSSNELGRVTDVLTRILAVYSAPKVLHEAGRLAWGQRR